MGLRTPAQYVDSLKDGERRALDAYPFKWAYAPPHDGATAVQFLRDIGADDGQVSVDAVQKEFEEMPRQTDAAAEDRTTAFAIDKLLTSAR